MLTTSQKIKQESSSGIIPYKRKTTEDNSHLNYTSKELGYHPVSLDPKEFIKDTREVKLDERYISLTSKVSEILSNKEIQWTKRINRPILATVSDKLAFPVSSGWANFNSVRHWRFVREVYEISKDFGLPDSRILSNAAAMHPYGNPIGFDDVYKADIGITEEYAKLFHNLQAHLATQLTIEEVKQTYKKSTFGGQPTWFYDNTIYQSEDVFFQIDSHLLHPAQRAIRKDYGSIKKSFLPYMEKILEKQINFSEVGFEYYQGDVLKLIEDHVLTLVVAGGRFNNPDAAKIIGSLTDRDAPREFKNRIVGFFTKDGRFIKGELDAEKFCIAYQKALNLLFPVIDTRYRIVNNPGFGPQLPAMTEARMVLQPLEESCNGFASIQDASISGYADFVRETYKENGDFIFLNGDRSNAETFVTTNYQQYEELIIPELRKLYRVQNTVCMVAPYLYTYSGLPSGISRTTMLNWYAGTHEALYTLGKLLNSKYEDIAKEYFNSIKRSQPFFKYKSFLIKLFMPTDDIPLIIYGNLNKLNLKWLDSKEVKDRMMKWEYSFESMRTFGMDFSKTEIKAAQANIIGKLFYSEFPGFHANDCFGLSERVKHLPDGLLNPIEKVLYKHYHTTFNYYHDYSKDFLSWLLQFGIPVSEVVDQYSPSGKIIYGKYVNEESFLESSRIPTKFLEPVFNYYRNLYINHLNQ